MTVDLGPHAGFILAAYGFAAAVIGGLAVAILLDYRRQRHRVAALDGARRRPPA